MEIDRISHAKPTKEEDELSLVSITPSCLGLKGKLSEKQGSAQQATVRNWSTFIVTSDHSSEPWWHIIWCVILRSHVAITTEYVCVFSRVTTLLLSQLFFSLIWRMRPPPEVLKCGMIEAAQVIIIETSIEKIYVLNGSFKSLAFCPRMVKDDWSVSSLYLS